MSTLLPAVFHPHSLALSIEGLFLLMGFVAGFITGLAWRGLRRLP